MKSLLFLFDAFEFFLLCLKMFAFLATTSLNNYVPYVNGRKMFVRAHVWLRPAAPNAGHKGIGSRRTG